MPDEPVRNLEALRQLRRVVVAAPDKLLNLNYFSLETECGTLRCSAGYAAIDPWFQGNTSINQILDPITGGIKSEYFSLDECDVLERTFGLSKENMRALFYPVNISDEDDDGEPKLISKPQVLAQIDRLLAGLDAVPYAELAVTS